ncbi:MAG: hypothetical protein IIC15_05875 [Thaumarchaeota archaeon]|nr:hypothetical protein [Nitrososphaerota archaeon]
MRNKIIGRCPSQTRIRIRRGISTVVTSAIMLSAVSIMGMMMLVWSQTSMMEQKIEIEENEAIKKIDQFPIKKSTDLTEDEHSILDMIKKTSDKTIGDLYNIYTEQGGTLVYKTFQRKIEKLQKNKFISVKKTSGGADGNTSIVKYANITKKLTEF